MSNFDKVTEQALKVLTEEEDLSMEDVRTLYDISYEENIASAVRLAFYAGYVKGYNKGKKENK